ncbi:MAG: hypothetical protein KF861_24665, partial [Planctomycetaceae bacterium]|nr:hypothetical protein [Planctomycetaceae bacterium]
MNSIETGNPCAEFLTSQKTTRWISTADFSTGECVAFRQHAHLTPRAFANGRTRGRNRAAQKIGVGVSSGPYDAGFNRLS